MRAFLALPIHVQDNSHIGAGKGSDRLGVGGDQIVQFPVYRIQEFLEGRIEQGILGRKVVHETTLGDTRGIGYRLNGHGR
ncbi:hypothetical protein D3C87_2079380 [compost metagenome]